MEEVYEKSSLRDRLIVAGIEELATHGVGDFSLRRVAAACGTSCAAPYRHFTDKDALIHSILLYINRQWELLRDSILAAWAGDDGRALTEVALAYVRFSYANPHYRRVLAETGEAAHGFAPELLAAYCATRSEEAARALTYRLPALLYGTVAMLESGELKNDEDGWRNIRAAVAELIARA